MPKSIQGNFSRYEVDNVTTMQTLAVKDDSIIKVGGYATVGDGGGGSFYYDLSSSEAANGGTIFGSGTGRWKRIIESGISVKDFGAKGDGITDDSTNIQLAITYAASIGGDTINFPEGTYICNTTILVNGEVQLVGSGYRSTIITGTAATLIRVAALGNAVKNLQVKAGVGTTICLSIKSTSGETGNTSSNNIIDKVWLDGTGKTAHGLYFDASEGKPNLWNIVNDLVVRDCNIGIAMKSNEVTNSILSYNNSNQFTNIDIHTVNSGWKLVVGALTMSSLSGTFSVAETVTGATSGATGVVKAQASATLLKIDNSVGIWSAGETLTGATSGATATFGVVAGDTKGNKFANLEIGAANVNEMDFGQAVTDRNVISAYMSFDFTGLTKIEDSNSLNMGGCIIQGNGVNKFYAMDAGDFSTVPLEIIRRGTTGAGSVFYKFTNATKSITVGLNTGVSGAPFHVDETIHATKAGLPAVVAETTGSAVSASFNRSDGAGSSLVEVKNTAKTILHGLNSGFSRSPFTIDTELRIAGAFRLVDGITEPATVATDAQLYVDSADGDLKIKFGDGTIKTIVVDT